METIWREVRLATRALRRSPGYFAAAATTLALGIGGVTAIFTLVEAALLRPLPYPEPERLVHLWETTSENPRRQLSYPDFLDLRAARGAFEEVAGYGMFGATFATPEGVVGLSGGRVSANFFATLGVAPVLGRTFRPEEDRPGRERDVVVLSHGAWRRRFGSDPAVIGRTVTLSGKPLTVIGVLPPDFQFARLGDPEIFVTLSPNPQLAERRFTHWMWGIARLAPGATIEGARAELATVARRRAADDARWHAGTGLGADGLARAVVGDVRPLVLGLLGGAAAVLLVACANVSGLALARAAGRERELAMRAALGGRRVQLAGPLVAESLVVALTGGVLGAVASLGLVRALAAAIPAERAQFLPFLADLRPRGAVLLFTFAICLVASLAVGLGPALRATRPRPGRLRDGARTVGGGGRLRAALVALQIALALGLVSSAGLLLRSLDRLERVDVGFARDRLVTAFVALPLARYETPESLAAATERLRERLGTLPGAEGAATLDRLPLGGSGNTGAPTVLGRGEAGAGAPDAQLRQVSDDYFRVAGVPLVAGREFGNADRPDAPRVAIVNRAFVREVLGGGEAVGQRVSFVFMDNAPIEIVGVVGDENVADLDAPPPAALYFAQRQSPAPSFYVAVRAAGAPAALERAIASEIRRVEPEALVDEVATVAELVAASPPVVLRRFPLQLLGGFAVLALVLAAVGVYGVASSYVGQRTREIGVRVAVGARWSDIQALVLRQGLGLAAAGVALGAAGAWGAGRLLSRLLFETGAAEPAVFGGAAATLVAMALLACAAPAWRASRVDPAVALRAE